MHVHVNIVELISIAMFFGRNIKIVDFAQCFKAFFLYSVTFPLYKKQKCDCRNIHQSYHSLTGVFDNKASRCFLYGQQIIPTRVKIV